mgnify:FL=1
MQMLVVLLISKKCLVSKSISPIRFFPTFGNFKLEHYVGGGSCSTFMYMLTSSCYASPTGVRSIECSYI